MLLHTPTTLATSTATTAPIAVTMEPTYYPTSLTVAPTNTEPYHRVTTKIYNSTFETSNGPDNVITSRYISNNYVNNTRSGTVGEFYSQFV